MRQIINSAAVIRDDPPHFKRQKAVVSRQVVEPLHCLAISPVIWGLSQWWRILSTVLLTPLLSNNHKGSEENYQQMELQL